MFRNYFKVALRNLSKQKLLSFISVFGLSVGIGCFCLFMLYAVNEFSFDSFNKNVNRIYRVTVWSEGKQDDGSHGYSYQPMPLGPAMKKDLPDVEGFVRFKESLGKSFLKVSGQVSREEVSFVDPSFFSIFSFKIISGNPASALQGLHSVVLTEATSKKLFGDINPIGKIIEIKAEDDFVPFTVTAIVENIPSNSSIQFTMLGNFNYLATTKNGARRVNNWHQYSYQTFVQLKPTSSLPLDKERLISFKKSYYPNEEKESRANGWTGKGPKIFYHLQPLSAMHTDTKISGGSVSPVDPKTIWILLSIATGVLLIACINFTTLAIGRSANRAKEVGVRKVIGGTKKTLITQFISESLLLAFISASLGFIVAELLLPSFNHLTGRQLNFSLVLFPQLTWLIVILVFLVGIMAGSYPAFILSGFKTVEVLKAKVKLGGSNIFTRSLVTLQFVVSSVLIISTIIIMQQLRFMQSEYPGFNKENIVIVDADGLSDTKKLYGLFKQKLASCPEFIGTASAELGLGGDEGSNQSSFKYEGKDRDVYEYFIDPDYIHLLGMTLITGRNFNASIASDTITSVIVNETMMREFGWTLQNAVGQRLKGYNENDDSKTPVVIGVIKDFNYLGFNSKIEPQMFQQFGSYLPYKFFVRTHPGNPAKALADLQSVWKNIASGYPLQYEFLDEDLDNFYKEEARWSSIVGWAGGISVFLACLGLLGLAALAVANRTKEIGIRKVLGASFTTIIHLLAKDFLKLVCLAFVIATPLAWYFMNRWLQDYAYRIHINWWVFAITGGVIILITLFTISIHTVKAAVANPVKSLRAE